MRTKRSQSIPTVYSTVFLRLDSHKCAKHEFWLQYNLLPRARKDKKCNENLNINPKRLIRFLH